MFELTANHSTGCFIFIQRKIKFRFANFQNDHERIAKSMIAYPVLHFTKTILQVIWVTCIIIIFNKTKHLNRNRPRTKHWWIYFVCLCLFLVKFLWASRRESVDFINFWNWCRVLIFLSFFTFLFSLSVCI